MSHHVGIDDVNPPCFDQKPIFPDVVVLLALLLGTQVSFVPQIIKLLIRRNSEGLNLITFLFGTLCNNAIAMDSVLTNWNRFNCCTLLTHWKCFQSLLAFLQVALNFINYWIILFLIVLFVKNTKEKPNSIFRYRLSFTLYSLWFGIGGSILTLYMAPLGKDSRYVVGLGIFWTVLSTTSNMIQWVPQIFTTWRHKGAGSLSLVTLCINAPGAYLNFVFMIRGGQSAGTYIPFFFAGTQQLILAIMLVVFRCKDRRNLKLQLNDSGSDDLIGGYSTQEEDLITKNA